MEAVCGYRRGLGWTKVTSGIYLPTPAPSEIERLQAWSLVLPARAAYTHLTGAALRGWWLPGPVPHPVFVASRKGETVPQRPGLHVTRLAEFPSAQVVGGVRVLDGAEILLAACRDLGLLDLVQLGDSALRHGDCTLDELTALAAQRRAGVVQLRRLIPLLDERSESPWESVMRLLHWAAGIEVKPQHKFFTPTGRFVARVDLWLKGTNRVHEYDGEVHLSREEQRRDLRRGRALVDLSIDRLGYTAREVLHEGGSIIASADRVLGRGWDPVRLKNWNALIADSLWGPIGRRRVDQRWRR